MLQNRELLASKVLRETPLFPQNVFVVCVSHLAIQKTESAVPQLERTGRRRPPALSHSRRLNLLIWKNTT